MLCLLLLSHYVHKDILSVSTWNSKPYPKFALEALAIDTAVITRTLTSGRSPASGYQDPDDSITNR